MFIYMGFDDFAGYWAVDPAECRINSLYPPHGEQSGKSRKEAKFLKIFKIKENKRIKKGVVLGRNFWPPSKETVTTKTYL